MSDKSQNNWCEFKDPNFDIRPKYFWRRYDSNKNRFYYRFEGDNVHTSIGITSALSECLVDGYGLDKWKATTPDWAKLLDDSAEYGTINHIVNLEYCTKGEVSNQWFDMVEAKWGKGEQLKRELVSWINFVRDYNVKIILSEAILSGQEYPDGSTVCTAIDYFVTMDFEVAEDVLVPTGEFFNTGQKAGQPRTKKERITTKKRVFAVIDVKSNFKDSINKQYFDAHRFQLLYARDCIIYNFGEQLGLKEEDILLFNWTPLSWKKSSGEKYKLHPQENKPNEFMAGQFKVNFDSKRMLYHHLLGLYKRRKLKPTGTICVFPKKFDSSFNNDSIKHLTYEEYVRYLHE